MGATCCTPGDVDHMPTNPNSIKIEKLNPNKVNVIWSRKRGETDPASTRVNSIMKASDHNNDGVLSFEESIRMCRKFLERSNIEAGENVDEETLHSIFESLDTNGDRRLDRGEVEMALKAMWLMTRDNIPFEYLTGEGIVENTEDTHGSTTKRGRARSHQRVKQPVKRKKLSQNKVEGVWVLKRGSNAEGPDDAAVERVMQKSKRAVNKTDSADGALTRTEAQRISKAFAKKANMKSEEVDLVFDYLDTNDDGVLDKEEIALGMKAMWLMSTDGVQLSELLVET